MSHQLTLCARIIRTGCLPEVLDYGITAEDFTTPEGLSIWTLIQNYNTMAQTRGSVLDMTGLLERYPTYALAPDRPDSSTHALCFAVRRERVQSGGMKAIGDAASLISTGIDPMVPLARLQAEVSAYLALGCTANADIGFSRGLASVMHRMQLQRDGVDLALMKWPWAAMNRATLGLQRDDYVVFYGRPKSMKTWTLACLVAWCYENEKKLVLYTKEMTPDNVYMRVLACIRRIMYEFVRDAYTMSENDWYAIQKLYHQLTLDPVLADTIVVLNGRDAPPGGDTVSWLNSKIDKHKPVVAFIDGLYLLSDQNKKSKDHERVTSISRDIRGMVLNSGVPVIATMQANRKAAGHTDANLDEIAYSDSLAQDCTAAIRTIQRKVNPTEEEKSRNPQAAPKMYIDLIFGGSREYSLHGIRLNAVPARDFSQLKELTEADVLASKEADAEEEEERKAARATKRRSAKAKAAQATAQGDIKGQQAAGEAAVAARM